MQTTKIEGTDLIQDSVNPNRKYYDFNGVEVDEVLTNDSAKWKVVVDEAYRPNKNIFVLKAFQDKFGQRFKSADDCYKAASRNKAASDFLKAVNNDYAATEKAPTYYRDILPNDVYEKLSYNLTQLRRNGAERQKELNAATLAYKKSMKELNDKWDADDAVYYTNKEMQIVSVKTPQLPLTLNMAINAYSPASASAPSRKTFASELLVNYKIGLLKALMSNPTIDIESLISNNIPK